MSDTQINPPDLDDVLDIWKNDILANINCIQIGKIEKVNSNQTVEIQIQIKRRISEKSIIKYPLLVDCPYIVLQGGGAYLDMPISIGDYCLILFNDRQIDDWWKTANVKEPRTRRKHSLSDAIALVGINPETKLLDRSGNYVRLLGKSGAGSEQFAARQNDNITIDGTSDTAFIAWIANVSAVLNGLIPGSVPSIPNTATGKITGGSNEVKIG